MSITSKRPLNIANARPRTRTHREGTRAAKREILAQRQVVYDGARRPPQGASGARRDWTVVAHST